MSKSINFIKQRVNPKIKKVHYFLDGCAGQYKNKIYLMLIVFRTFLPQVMASHLAMAFVAQSKD